PSADILFIPSPGRRRRTVARRVPDETLQCQSLARAGRVYATDGPGKEPLDGRGTGQGNVGRLRGVRLSQAVRTAPSRHHLQPQLDRKPTWLPAECPHDE